jgi:hypothetical protein
VFYAYALFIAVWVLPLVSGIIRAFRNKTIKRHHKHPFPWWGWLGVITGVLFWFFAWTRIPWFALFQPHTFTPLWLSYLLVINGLIFRRKGSTVLIQKPLYFMLLFPASAVFWWFFEYLNRFVQNWSYMGVPYSPWEYFCYASISFSTVLPAVITTRAWFMEMDWIQRGFGGWLKIRFRRPVIPAWFFLMLACFGLLGVGIWPDLLFPILWVAPLLIIVCFQTLRGGKTIFHPLAEGDWKPVVSAALAALFCGVFWEMWNIYSLAKWIYHIPYVHRFQVFQMPMLGYAGYLPFGLECIVLGEIIETLIPDRKKS